MQIPTNRHASNVTVLALRQNWGGALGSWLRAAAGVLAAPTGMLGGMLTSLTARAKRMVRRAVPVTHDSSASASDFVGEISDPNQGPNRSTAQLTHSTRRVESRQVVQATGSFMRAADVSRTTNAVRTCVHMQSCTEVLNTAPNTLFSNKSLFSNDFFA